MSLMSWSHHDPLHKEFNSLTLSLLNMAVSAPVRDIRIYGRGARETEISLIDVLIISQSLNHQRLYFDCIDSKNPINSCVVIRNYLSISFGNVT